MLKIAFFSNFLNHHQMPLCRALAASDGVDFTFVATEPIAAERLNMGYADMNAADFVLREYEEGGKAAAMQLALSADVMIFGAAPIQYLATRMQENKLTFYFSERVLKLGYWRRFVPSIRRKINAQYVDHAQKQLYVLGASAYMAGDMSVLGFPTEKCLQWGYFPEIVAKDVDALFANRRQRNHVQILYAGRLLTLKRVIDAVRAVKLLRDYGVDGFRFTIIGDGEQKAALEKYVQKYGLTDYVEFLPFMPAADVRKVMDEADVYYFGSDFKEGWGAVVNEAMNSACAVVVSHAVGAAASMIDSDKNGIIYPCGNVKALAESLKKLILDRKRVEFLGRNAYETVTRGWTADVAAHRIVELSRQIMRDGKITSPYDSGVCSTAPVLKNGWIRHSSNKN